MKVSSIEVVRLFKQKDLNEFSKANQAADEYWLKGMPVEVLRSEASKKFGEFIVMF